MPNLVIIIALVLYAILACLKREWGVYLVVLLLPSYQIRFSVGFVPMTFLESLILLLAAVTLGDLLWKKKLKTAWRELFALDRKTLALICLFLFASLCAVFVSPVPIKAAGIFKAYFLEAVAFYFLVRLIITSPQKIQKLCQTLAALTLYLSLFGIYQFLTLYNLPFPWWGVGVASRRITSLLNHPNALALLLGPLVAAQIFLPQKTKLHLLAIVFGLGALYLSFSRASWLALAVTILAWAFVKISQSGSVSPFFAERGYWKMLVILLSLVALVFVIPYSRTILLDLTSGEAATQQNRYVLWSAAWDMLKKSPVWGAGLMGFHEYYKNYPLGPDRVVQNYPHNYFFNFWLELGLLGLFSMLGLLFVFFRKVSRQIKNGGSYALLAAAGMSMIVLHGLVDVSYFKNDLSVLFWLIFALPDLCFTVSA